MFKYRWSVSSLYNNSPQLCRNLLLKSVNIYMCVCVCVCVCVCFHHYYLSMFHLRILVVSCHGWLILILPACGWVCVWVCVCVCACACLFSAHQFVSSVTWRWVWRATSLDAWLPVCSPVCLFHLWVLVVSWHGWPMSLWVGDEPGLKYSSAVSAAGLVTAGHDIWVTRACGKQILNYKISWCDRMSPF